MTSKLLATFLSLLLATTPAYVRAADEPAPSSVPSEAPSPRELPVLPALCCALPPDHGLDLEAPNIYRMLGYDFDPLHPRQIDSTGLRARLTDFKSKLRNVAERRTGQVLEDMIEHRRTQQLYDWFLQHLNATPDAYHGTGIEHVALFDRFRSHLDKTRGRGVKLEDFEMQAALVAYLDDADRPFDRYLTESMQLEVERTKAGAQATKKAVSEEFKGFYSWRLPWVFLCGAGLAVLGGIAHFHPRPYSDGVAPVEDRLPAVIDRETIRHPVPPPPEARALENDPGFKHGQEAAEDLFGPPPEK